MLHCYVCPMDVETFEDHVHVPKTVAVPRFWGKEATICIPDCKLPQDHIGCCFR